MSKQIAIIEYMFIFDPVNTWQHGYQFENDLESFLASHGFETEMVDITGGAAKRAVYITRMVQVPTSKAPPVSNPLQQAKKIVQRIPDKSFKKYINQRQKFTPLPKLKYKGGK